MIQCSCSKLEEFSNILSETSELKEFFKYLKVISEVFKNAITKNSIDLGIQYRALGATDFFCSSSQWRTQEKISGGGVQGRGSGLVGGPGGGAPRTPENFRKFAKNSLRKLQKYCIFAYFAKKFQTMR